MIDLTAYGFKEIKREEKFTEYEGHGLYVRYYDYLYIPVSGGELNRRSFVVSTKQTSSMSLNEEQMKLWLEDRNINPE